MLSLPPKANCPGALSVVIVTGTGALARCDLKAASQERAMEIDGLHHVALPCADLERSRRFYQEVFGLVEIPRPALPVAGAWFRVGDRQELHLVVGDPQATFRGTKGMDTNDIHFAVRVKAYRHALEALRAKGYREDASPDDPLAIRTSMRVGYPQIYILDPDRNIIEINAASDD
jgi:catechol 2,3-dioxygenase-like lactoylglutathione lyase family enzyme